MPDSNGYPTWDEMQKEAGYKTQAEVQEERGIRDFQGYEIDSDGNVMNPQTPLDKKSRQKEKEEEGRKGWAWFGGSSSTPETYTYNGDGTYRNSRGQECDENGNLY
jgi:hypothetical protein